MIETVDPLWGLLDCWEQTHPSFARVGHTAPSRSNSVIAFPNNYSPRGVLLSKAKTSSPRLREGFLMSMELSS
jgi:hypothetical protein